MKTIITIKTTLTAMLLLFLMVSCSKEEHNPLLGQWKCLGFGEITNTGKVLFKEIEQDCEKCYSTSFGEDYHFSGYDVGNSYSGEYSINKSSLVFAHTITTLRGLIGVYEDPNYKYLFNSNVNYKFIVENMKMRIYYSDNKYALFVKK